MAKESLKRRRFIIRKKRKRREKIKKLKEKYLEAKSKEEKEEIIKKALKINPNLNSDYFENLT